MSTTTTLTKQVLKYDSNRECEALDYGAQGDSVRARLAAGCWLGWWLAHRSRILTRCYLLISKYFNRNPPAAAEPGLDNTWQHHLIIHGGNSEYNLRTHFTYKYEYTGRDSGYWRDSYQRHREENDTVS